MAINRVGQLFKLPSRAIINYVNKVRGVKFGYQIPGLSPKIRV